MVETGIAAINFSNKNSLTAQGIMEVEDTRSGDLYCYEDLIS
jgi:hypothetical protein